MAAAETAIATMAIMATISATEMETAMAPTAMAAATTEMAITEMAITATEMPTGTTRNSRAGVRGR
jgi:hypothetical protein